ncbi:MAG: BON domain-containing protein [Dehalococcoidia bacterium]|nr:BON domain-containing protein [Dehalococcoidia bacterium]
MAEIRKARSTRPRLWSRQAKNEQGSPRRDYDPAVRRIVDALRRQCNLDADTCDLEIRDGVAYIRGNVGNLSQKRAITQTILSLPGVKAIVNDLRIAPGAPRPDRNIASDVEHALSKFAVPHSSPVIRVQDGVAYVSGRLSSESTQVAVEEACWMVRGVVDVVNNTSLAIPHSRSDDALLQDVGETLSHCLGIQCQQLRAEIHDGVVYLSGQIGSEYQKFVAEDALRWLPGVTDVVNELNITGFGDGDAAWAPEALQMC